MRSASLVRVIRSGLTESVHLGDAAVVDAEGNLIASVGDPERAIFARSSMKPLQASVSMSLAGVEFDDRQVAVMCASHNAEPIHVETVRSLLRAADVPEEALQCPVRRPSDDDAAAEDPTLRAINSDCSGKHGGMLAACRTQGWDLSSYRQQDHPLQRATLRAVLDASGRDDVEVGIDGCGVPVHGMPLWAMARIYARMASPGRSDLAPFFRRATEAMRAEPYLVAGRNRPDTAVMKASPDAIAKGGAEGLMCAALLSRGVGVAVKVADGAARAAGPALIRILRLLGAFDEDGSDSLAAFSRPAVLGGGLPVGEMVAEFDLNLA